MNKGREKQKVFVYREDGSRYAEFESETEFAKHFDVAKNFMATKRKKLFGEEIVKIFGRKKLFKTSCLCRGIAS